MSFRTDFMENHPARRQQCSGSISAYLPVSSLRSETGPAERWGRNNASSQSLMPTSCPCRLFI